MQETRKEVRNILDTDELRGRGYERVLDAAMNLFLLHSHMGRIVRQNMLEFRACVDGTFCQVLHPPRRACNSSPLSRGSRWCHAPTVLHRLHATCVYA